MSREIIKIKVGVGRVDAVAGAAEDTVVGVFSDGKGGAVFRKLDKALNGGLSQVLGRGFQGRGEHDGGGLWQQGHHARRVVMVAQRPGEVDGGAVRQAAGRAASMAVDLKAKKAIFAAPWRPAEASAGGTGAGDCGGGALRGVSLG